MSEGTLADRWRDTMSRFGDAPAVRDEHTVLSYVELDRLRAAIGAAVADRVPVGGRVGVVVPKTVWSFAAIHGVPGAGRSALLLDPGEPGSRWAEHCRRVGAELVLADAPDLRGRARDAGLAVLGPGDVSCDATAPEIDFDPDAEVWIMCTSGSTGVPKLVATSQRTLVDVWDRNVRRMETWGELGSAVIVLPPLWSSAMRTPCYQALIGGACAVLVDTACTPPDRILDLLDEHDAHRLHLGPWLLRSLADAAGTRGRSVPAVTMIVSTGAPLRVEDLEHAWECFPRARIQSHYGSTEVGLIAVAELRPGDDVSGPHALAFTIEPSARVNVVADDGRACAPGEQGEIWAYTALGLGSYLDAPDLEADFVLLDDDRTPWARTGDLGRLLSDGRLLVDGRDDARVKVNGIAVDLNAVTTAVRALDSVRDAEVSVVPRGDDVQLVAWVVPADELLSVRDLRAGLARTLPRSMLPHVFRAIGEIPRLPNGKVDRVALRTAAAAELPSGAPRALPSTPVERTLVGMFEAVLDRRDVGLHESFFELGGDSLGALELVVAVDARFGLPDARRPALESAMMTDGTVAALAAVVAATDSPAVDGEAATMRPDGVGVLMLGDGPPEGVPIVLLPGGGQYPLRFRPLVRRLDACRVWILTPRGFHTRAPADRRVDRMAARFADALLSLDPRGEYVLVGWSFGAIVAHQLATELVGRGARVRLLVLLDMLAPGSRPRLGDQGVQPLVRRRWRRIPRGVWARLRRSYLGATAGILRREGESQYQAFMARTRLLMRHFAPAAYGGRVLVVRSEQSVRQGLPPDLGWARYLTGEWTHLDVRGDHFGMLLEPSVGEIGQELASAAVTSEVSETIT